MNVKWRSKSSAHNIVYAGIVRPVRDVESLSRESQTTLFANFENSAQAHVERCVIGAQTAVPRSAGRTVVGEMIVTIDVRASQKVKRMAAVVADNRRQLKSGQDTGTLPGASQHCSKHHFMALIKIR